MSEGSHPTRTRSESEQVYDKFLSYEQKNEEYQEAVKSIAIDVPDDFSFPECASGANEKIIYQPGSGVVEAHLLAVEAIECALLDAHHAGDKEGVERWIAAANAWVNSDIFHRFNDHSAPISWFDDLIAPAAEGNFENLENMVDYRRVTA